MFRYSILQPPKCLLDESIIDTIFNSIYKNISLPQNGVINIVCVSPKEIRTLNNQYRKKNTVTDVLSFHYFEGFGEVTKDEIAGEIILCEECIIEGGEEYGLGVEKEFYKLIIHSALHLLGYDHEAEQDYKKMQAQEDIIWSEVFGK